MVWSREGTPWRQGSILAQGHFQAVNLADNAGDANLAVAISHDCDIANDNCNNDEPAVEFILARRLEQKDGKYTRGKNPRVLHLDYKHMGETVPVTLELIASKKRTVQKSSLAGIEPDEDYELTDKEAKILQSWLAVRYKRPALPGSLFERLRYVSKAIEKAGERNPLGILSFRLSYKPKGELLPKEPYEIKLSIVYTLDKDEYAQMAKCLAKKLKEKFPELLKKTREHGPVDLRLCEAVSEMKFTLRDMRDSVEYRAEHISYRTDPPGPVIE